MDSLKGYQIQELINDVPNNKGLDTDSLKNISIEDILETINIYQQELEFQNLELVRAHEDLMLSKKKYSELFYEAPVAYVLFDEDKKILESNLAFEKLIGMDTAKILHSKITQYIHPDYQDTFYLHLYNQALDQTPDNIEIILKGGDQEHYVVLHFNDVATDPSTGEGKVIRMALTDISAIKRKEQELAKQKSYMESIIASIPDLMFVIDKEYVFVDLRSGNNDDLYLPRELFIGKDLRDVLPSSLSDSLIQGIIKVLAGQPAGPIQYRLPVNNKLFDYEARLTMFGTDNVIGMVRNITDKVQAEHALKESVLRFHQLAEQSRTFTWEVGTDGIYTYLSEVFINVAGYEPSEVVGKLHFYDFHPENGREAFMNAAFETFNRKEPFTNLENLIVTKDGKEVWVSTNGIPMLNADGALLGYRGTDADINETKLAKHALVKSDMLLKKLSDSVPGVIFQFRSYPNGRNCFPFVTKNIWHICEVTPYEVKDNWGKVRSRIHPDDYIRVAQSFQESFNTLKDIVLDFRVNLPERGLRWLQITAHPEKQIDGSVLWHGYASDITAQKFIGLELQKSKEQYELAINGTNDGIWDWNLETNELFLSKRWKNLLGYQDHELKNELDTFASLLCGEDVERVNQFIVKYLNGKVKKYAIEFRMKHKNGTLVWILARGEAVRNEQGVPIRMAGSHSDITEKKRSEDLLKENKLRLELAMDAGKHGFWDWDLISGETYFSPVYYTMLGYEDKELPMEIGTFNQLVHPSDKGAIMSKVRECTVEGKPFEMEYRLLCKDGQYKWIAGKGKSYFNKGSGKPIRAVGVHIDIDEKKKFAERLQESETNFRTFFETIDDMIFIGNQHGDLSYTNRAVTKKLGYAVEELKLMHILDVHSQYDRKAAEVIFGEMFSGRRISCPLPLSKKDGNLVPVETRIWFGKWDGKDCIFGISKDLSKEQEALQKFNKLFENNPALMAVSSLPDQKFVEVNISFLNTLGYAKNEVIGKSNEELVLFVDPVEQAEVARQLRENGRIINIELKIRSKSDKIITGLFSGEIIESQGKLYFLTVMADITEQKQAEDEIKRQSAERKRSEEELVKTTELLEQTAKMARVGAWEVDLIDNTAHWSSVTMEIHEVPKDFKADINKIFSFIKDVESRKRIIDVWDKTIEKGTIFDEEVMLTTAKGNERWIRMLGKGEFKNGQCARIYGTVQDISQRKQATFELDQTRQKLTSIFNEMEDVVWSVKFPDNKMLFITPSVEKLYGISPEVWMSNNINWWKRTFHPEDKHKIAEIYSLLEKHGHYVMQYRIMTKDNTVKWVENKGKVVYDKNNVPIRISGITTDITAIKAVENELKNMASLQNILMNMASEYINLGISDIELGINRSLSELGIFVGADRAYIFDYDWKNNQTSNTYEWCANGIAPQMDKLQNLLLGSIPYWAETHKIGQIINIPDVYALPVGDSARKILEEQEIKSLIAIPMMDNDKCIGFIGFDSVASHHDYSEKEKSLLLVFAQILVNLTKRHQLETSLVLEKEKANAANNAKSEFLASMSHEIRTPMNSILGFSEIMLNTTYDTKQKSYLKTILESGKTLLSLINDILDLSKIEAGRLDISPELTDLRMITNEIVQLFLHKCKEKGIDLIIEIDEHFPSAIMIDEVRLKQILLNLLGNAIKFTHNGHVKIEVKSLNNKNGTIDFSLSVIDTGIGIPEKEQLRIFESFTQQSGQDSRKYGGTGLGLAICKRLCELMYGELNLESISGEGSRFTISFNDIKYSDVIVEGEGEYFWKDDHLIFKGSKILIVDDVANNRNLAITYLEGYDLKIFEAESGEMAIESVNANMPDLVFMDIRMPGIDGYEATRMIKTNPKTANVQVVALTASTMHSEFEKLQNIFDGYLRKPLQKKSLINEMAKHLPWEKAPSGQTDDPNNIAQTLVVPIIDRPVAISDEVKGKFRGLFFGEIADQISFITIDRLNELVSNIMGFAIEQSIPQLKNKTEELDRYVEAFEYDKILECLISVQDMFKDKN